MRRIFPRWSLRARFGRNEKGQVLTEHIVLLMFPVTLIPLLGAIRMTFQNIFVVIEQTIAQVI